MAASKTNKAAPAVEQKSRDFIVVATYAMGAVGAGAFAWPLIDQMNPAADTLALASIEVDVSKIAEGQSITLKWRGKPVFIRHRERLRLTRPKLLTRWICVIRRQMMTVYRNLSIWWFWASVPIWAVCLLARKWARFAANMMAGSACAMAHTMIHQAGFCKGPAPTN